MIIYPDIELQQGRCVNLRRGRAEEPTVYDVDPVEAARDFVRQGAEWIHVVDLDAVFNHGDNAALVERIIKEAGCPVQVGGAIRSMERVNHWIEAGAMRVVIATAAVKYPHLVREAATAYPGQVVVSIDARGGKVVVEGWREATIFTPIDFARQFEDVPLAAFIYTDIDFDDDEPDSSLSQLTDLAAAVKTPVIASGVVKSLQDVSVLQYLPNISGVISSRALFGKTFTLEEALAITHEPAPEPAPFI